MIVLLLALSIALAQPVTRWHTDANIRLPTGAVLISAERCQELAIALGQEQHDVTCYHWSQDLGGSTYALLTLAFENAGYTLTNEGPLPGAPGTLTVFTGPRPHVLFTLYGSESVTVLTYSPAE